MERADLLIPIIESIRDNIASKSEKISIYRDIIDICGELDVEDLLEMEDIDEEFDKIVREND